jgi:23S rRNA-/tRNA-specific pseudouridylate synthase
MTSIGHPIIGDPIYARKSHQSEYLALVAKSITVAHPKTGREMTFYAPYPEHFIELARRYGYDLEVDR